MIKCRHVVTPVVVFCRLYDFPGELLSGFLKVFGRFCDLFYLLLGFLLLYRLLIFFLHLSPYVSIFDTSPKVLITGKVHPVAICTEFLLFWLFPHFERGGHEHRDWVVVTEGWHDVVVWVVVSRFCCRHDTTICAKIDGFCAAKQQQTSEIRLLHF